MAKREKVEHAEELRWGQLELLLKFPEQVEYERIRPPVVFGGSVAESSPDRNPGNDASPQDRRLRERRHAQPVRDGAGRAPWHPGP
jgi:hypothetical protein